MLASLGLSASGETLPEGNATAYLQAPHSPVQIRVSFFLINILDIDDVGQTVTLDYLVVQSWQDARLADSAMSDPARKERMGLEDIWNPALAPVNLQSSVAQDRQLTIDSAGNVTFRYRNIDTFVAPLDLRQFPFDEQVIRVKFLSRLYGPDDVLPVWDREKSGHMDHFSLTGWTFKGMDIRISSDHIRMIGEYGRELSSITIQLELERLSSFYVWKVVIPLAFIVFMAWAVFWIDPTQLGGQLGISTSSVITLIAFQLSLAELLPKISYLTRMDIYALGASGLIFLALGEAVLTAGLARKGRVELSGIIDLVMRFAYPAMFLLLLIIVVI